MTNKKRFKALEAIPENSRINARTIFDNLSYNDNGLIPVITQDQQSKQVLMMAWMNKASLNYSLNNGVMTYWSRSRNSLWKKGESSGHWQHIVSMQVDCDGDALLFRVNQVGAACHTGRRHCFYFSLDADTHEFLITSDPGH